MAMLPRKPTRVELKAEDAKELDVLKAKRANDLAMAQAVAAAASTASGLPNQSNSTGNLLALRSKQHSVTTRCICDLES